MLELQNIGYAVEEGNTKDVCRKQRPPSLKRLLHMERKTRNVQNAQEPYTGICRPPGSCEGDNEQV